MISWALNLAPVPADRGGQPSSACKFVLVGLANHAGPDGTGAFPSVATLVRYTGLAERTVRTCLDRLQAEGIIQPCDPDIVAARIKRADRRPQGWDLNLAMVRGDLAAADIGVLEHQFPGLGARLDSTGQAGPDAASHRVQPSHPDPRSGEPVDNPDDWVQQLHPASGTGCNQRTTGVQPAPARGAAVAPEPYKEPSREPPAAAPARETPPAARGGSAAEYFAALGDRWQLTGRQRARLIPAVTAALDAGWTPHALAAFTGASTTGVRNPYAVLAARLSPGELPPPQAQRANRPPWCGECDQATRMLGFDGDSPSPCPRCKPLATRPRGLSRESRFELRPPVSRASPPSAGG
ncbi:MAG: helix-turn-helix domain-containing protein [Streptosporangiaceae bacterium]